MKASFALLFILIISSLQLSAQSDSTKLFAKFRFRDGIYHTANDLKNNKPNGVSADLTKNAIVTDNVIQFTKEGTNSVINTAWCIVKDGVPYVNYSENEVNSNIIIFYKLQIQGKICYFSYTRNEYKKVPMNVFDPQSGQLVYTSFIQNRERTVYRFMTRLSDGAILPFTRPNLQTWAADDKKIIATIADLKEDDELYARLFKSLLVYNDRNTIWIKK